MAAMVRWMPVFVVLVACGDPKTQPDAATDPPSDAPVDADPNNPPTLLDTGLCVDPACTQISSDVRPYKPRWELYSDGATKRRWIYLPPGTQIDTSNMDFWQFPVGTKLWKEFTRDGVRVETRLVMRIGEDDTKDDWFYVAYVWNESQDGTTAEPFGVSDVNGTEHDVPSRAQCRECHDSLQPSRVLGFSALQLDHDDTASGITLDTLVTEGLLSAPPTKPSSGPYFPLPLDVFETATPALGYLHANCGHCHNPTSEAYNDKGVEMQLRMTVDALGSLSETNTYATTILVEGTTGGVDGVKTLVTPGSLEQSQLYLRFESTNPAVRMPAVGTEIVDEAGKSLLRDWILGLN